MTARLVILELALPKCFFSIWLQSFIGDPSFSLRTGFPMKCRYQILKKNLNDTNSGMTNGEVLS